MRAINYAHSADYARRLSYQSIDYGNVFGIIDLACHRNEFEVTIKIDDIIPSDMKDKRKNTFYVL